MIPTVTFQSLLQDVSAHELPFYESAADLTSIHRLQRKAYANTAMDWIWRCPNRMFAWDFSVATKTIAIANGKFDPSEIGYSDWWNLWTEDPRPLYKTGSTFPFSRNRVRAEKDAEGIWPRTEGANVFAFYRLPAPQFSCTKVVGATTYGAGSAVYDEDATGDCYVALVSALGSAISDPAKWTRQLVPKQLNNVMQQLIIAQIRDLNRSADASASAQKMAEQWLDLEMMRQMPKSDAMPPWAYNAAGQYFDRLPYS